MSKIKILVIPSDRTGVSKFRSVDPHLSLQNLFPDDFWVDVDYEPQLENDEYLKQYDIIHYHRTLSPNYDLSKKVAPKLKKMGITSIMDIDDYWLPTIDHPAHMMVKQNNLDELIMENIRLAEHVNTTTPIFADEIKKLNSSVEVFPNAVDPREKQFQSDTQDSDRLRVGWLGGSSHMEDLRILSGVVGKLQPYIDKLQFVLCGFDTRGSITFIDQATGEQKQRPIEPHESIWYKYEEIFTNKFTTVSPQYHKHLLKFIDEEYNNEDDVPYRRVWTKPITTYASNYNKFDVSLAPIKEHTFNRVKSQLKVIEAGFHKKALIAQNYGPYQIDLINAAKYGGGFTNEGNALLVDTHKNHKMWDKHIKTLLNNPSLREDLGERLYETVQKYHIDVVTRNRAEYYKMLVDKNNKN
jgi:glycosyltransferase involved in cell wall biosynthesis